MEKVLKNKKGFTLIELLAVIVILAILVMVAIPAVTRYLNSARQGTYADNALAAISAVRNDVIMNGFAPDDGQTSEPYKYTYDKDEINGLLEKKLNTSPFGGTYTTAEIVVVQIEKTKTVGGTTTGTGEYEYLYQMCLVDDGGHGFDYTFEKNIEAKAVKMTGAACNSNNIKTSE